MTEPPDMDYRDARTEDPARFLRALRELRNHAGLGHAELAARAHYPCDTIKAAEAGPALPDLPVLSAYVRGCGGTFADWEERWRSLTGSPASSLLPARAAGCSEAASAGARVSISSATADGHDPALVMAALNRVADGMAASSPALPAPRGSADSVAPDALIPDEALWDAAAAAWAAAELTSEVASELASDTAQAAQADYLALAATTPEAATSVAASGDAPAVTSPVTGDSGTSAGGQLPGSRSSRHTLPPRPALAVLVAAALLLIVAGLALVL